MPDHENQQINPRHRQQQVAFIIKSSLLAIIGCIVIVMAVPFAISRLAAGRINAAADAAPEKAVPHLLRQQSTVRPFCRLSVDVERRLAAAYAAQGQYDDAAAAAQRIYQRLTTPPEKRMPSPDSLRTRLIALGAQFYNRIQSNRIPNDPWLAYRQLEQTYREADDRAGSRHLRDHLDHFYTDHPWQDDPPAQQATTIPTTDSAPPRSPTPATRQPTPHDARPTPPPPPPPPDDGPQWAIVIPGGAMTYNAHRERLREIPAGTLVDVLEHHTWDSEPMVLTRIFHLNRWISNIYIRTAHLHVQPGSATDISDRERQLHLRRLQLLDRIAHEEQRKPPTPKPPPQTAPPPSNQTADTPSPQQARRDLQALEQRIHQLRQELEGAQGPRRTEIIDEMRRAGYERYRLQKAAAGVVESLEISDPPPRQTAPTAPAAPEESPRLQRLRKELNGIETQLRQLAATRK